MERRPEATTLKTSSGRDGDSIHYGMERHPEATTLNTSSGSDGDVRAAVM